MGVQREGLCTVGMSATVVPQHVPEVEVLDIIVFVEDTVQSVDSDTYNGAFIQVAHQWAQKFYVRASSQKSELDLTI